MLNSEIIKESHQGMMSTIIPKSIPQMVSDLLGGIPVRWSNNIGNFDGCERTLEVFGVDAAEQLSSLQKLRSIQKIYGSFIVIFHTRSETERLYSDFVKEWKQVNSPSVIWQRWVDVEIHVGESIPPRKAI